MERTASKLLSLQGGASYATGIVASALTFLLFWTLPQIREMPIAVIILVALVLVLRVGIGPAIVYTVSTFLAVRSFFLTVDGEGVEYTILRISLLSVMMLVAVVLRKSFQREQQHRERLTVALKSRDEFLTVAGHELKTPLTSLLLTTRRLEKTCTCGENKKSLETMGRQVNRLSELVNSLTDMSKLSSGRVDYEFATLDFCELVEEVIERMNPSLAENGCHISMSCKIKDLITVGDRTRLAQVVTNLVANACKYAGRDLIEVEVSGDPGHVKLVVKDHGPGIPAEKLETIFERYERAVIEKQKYLGGLGLGLWISREIVKAHGGDIWAKSVLGQGSTFIVVLPRRQW